MASDSFAQYLKEASRYPLLDKSQEILLARQVQTWLHDPEATPRQKKAGQRAYEKLINCNLRLVVSVAKRFSGRIKRSEMLDIVQEGNCGLLTASKSSTQREVTLFRLTFTGGFGKVFLVTSAVVIGLFGYRRTLSKCWRKFVRGLRRSRRVTVVCRRLKSVLNTARPRPKG